MLENNEGNKIDDATDDSVSHDEGHAMDPTVVAEPVADDAADGGDPGDRPTGADEPASAGDPRDDHHRRRRILTIVLAILAVAVIAMAAWSMGEYVAGRDPLALFRGDQGTSQSTAVVTDGGAGDATSADHTAEGGQATTTDDEEAATTTTDGATTQGGGDEGAASPSSSASTDNGASDGRGDSGVASDAGQITVTQSVDGASRKVEVAAGSTVLDVLKASGVPYTATNGTFGAYVTAIDGRAAGSDTGWTYSVNGEEPNVGCGSYEVSAGDVIAWSFVTVG